MASTRGISLVRYSQERVFVPGIGQAVRLVVQASDAVMMPNEVFGHAKTLKDAYTGEQRDEYQFVCSPFDLVIYPIGEPSPTQFPAYYRRDRVDVLLPSQTMADELWQSLHQEVCTLVDALNKLDRLRLQETVRCGADLDTETSSTSSLASSMSP